MGIFNVKLPGQEYLGAIAVGREVSDIKTAAAALNYAMRLASIEYHNRTPGQGDSIIDRGKMQVEISVLAQEEIAEGCTTVLPAVMVVLRAAAGHEGYVTGDKHARQSKRAGPIGRRLHAARVIRPARSRPRQRHSLDVSGLQDQARRYLSFPVRKQTRRGHRHVDRAC